MANRVFPCCGITARLKVTEGEREGREWVLLTKKGAMSKGRRCATDTGRYLYRVDFSGDGKEEKALVLVAVKKTGCRCRGMDETGCRCRKL